MIGLLAGLAIGLGAGIAITTVAWRRRAKLQRIGECPDPEVHQLTDADRAQIAGEFQMHTTALHEQVSQYADLLAGDDPVLRAQLRQFERGGRRS